MMKLLSIGCLLLVALPCHGATWTYVIDKTTVAPAACRNQEGFVVDVVLQDDATPTPNEERKQICAQSAGDARSQAEQIVKAFTERDAIKATGDVSAPPSAIPAAIAKLCADINDLGKLIRMEDMGLTAVTPTRTQLQADINAAITAGINSPAKLAAFLSCSQAMDSTR